MSRIVFVAILLAAAVLLLPLISASVSRPFGWWDYFEGEGLFKRVSSLQGLMYSYLEHLWHGFYICRPTYILLYYSEKAVFGGQYWLYYLVKWLSKLAAVGLTGFLLHRLGARFWACAAVCAVLLFHPMDFEAMLLVLDGWLVFFLFIAFALLFYRRPASAVFDLSSLSATRYGFVLLSWYLALGCKETGLVPAALSAALFAFYSGRRWWRRWLPFVLIEVYWVWRLTGAANRAQNPPRVILRYAWEHWTYLAPVSPFHYLAILFTVLLAYGVFRMVGSSEPGVGTFGLFCAASGILLLFMASAATLASRNVIPTLYLLSIPAGYGLSALPNRIRPWACALVFLSPLFSGSDIFGQSLAYQQEFYEQADAISYLENRAAEGDELAVTGLYSGGELGQESQHAVRDFFASFGPALFHLPARPVRSLTDDGIPPNSFAFVSALDPFTFQAHFPALDARRIAGVYQFEMRSYGIVEPFHAAFARFDEILNNVHPILGDLGAPGIRWNPVLFVYRVNDSSALASDTVPAMETQSYHSGQRTTVSLAQPVEETVAPNEGWTGKVSLGYGPDASAVSLMTSATVLSGDVAFGVTDETGHDIWNVKLPAQGTPQTLATPTGLPFSSGHHYYAFFFVDDRGGHFKIAPAKLQRTFQLHMLQPFRRYGAIGM